MENINLELYKVFCSVAKYRNITKAAQELMISQPAVTQTIKKLEEQLECNLFFRTKKGMSLTEEGEFLYNDIKNSIDSLDQCKHKLNTLKNEENQVIRIGGGTTLLKHNALEGFKKFREKYPKIKIEITKDITKNLFDMLESDCLDLIFFNMSSPSNNIDQIKVIPIENVCDAFVASTKEFGYLKGKKINLKDISNLPLVLQSEVSTSRKYLNSICQKHHVLLSDSYDLSSYELVISFVKVGLGIGFINKNNIKEELKNNELFEIETDYQIPSRKIGIAISRKKEKNPYLNEFIKCIKRG